MHPLPMNGSPFICEGKGSLGIGAVREMGMWREPCVSLFFLFVAGKEIAYAGRDNSAGNEADGLLVHRFY